VWKLFAATTIQKRERELLEEKFSPKNCQSELNAPNNPDQPDVLVRLSKYAKTK
jgi:hypothetical protein